MKLFTCGMAILVVLIGVAMTGLGVWLLSLGGSFYYAPAGIALTLCGWLLWRGDSRATMLYAGFLLATIAWSFWEVGLDVWGLLPRIAAPVALGGGVLLCEIGRGARAHGR